MSQEHDQQIDKNYTAFIKKLPEILPEKAGKFALMHDGEIVEYFDTARDAYIAGMKLYNDGLFSIQEITDIPINLGFFSHAVS